MRKQIRVLSAFYKDVRLSDKTGSRLRGFFADLDRQDSELHNHYEEGNPIYRYPLVQYKVINGIPVIFAIEKGIERIYPHLISKRMLIVGKQIFHDPAVEIHVRSMVVGDCENVYVYRFLTPWLALNQDNYQVYMEDYQNQSRLLESILIGNILAAYKGMDIQIENRLQVQFHLTPTRVKYKGQNMIGFEGAFVANCILPDLCGIGKGSGRGFGCIRVEEELE